MDKDTIVKALRVLSVLSGAASIFLFGAYFGSNYTVKKYRKHVNKSSDLASETLWRVIQTAKNGALTHEEFDEEINNVFKFLTIVTNEE